MGGIVITNVGLTLQSTRDLADTTPQALIEAQSRRTKEDDTLIACIAGCVFFGTPFLGTDMASLAEHLASSRVFAGFATETSLLKTLAMGNDFLRHMRREFTRLVTRTKPDIQIVCFYEEVEIGLATLRNTFGFLEVFLERAKKVLPKVSFQVRFWKHRHLQ